MFACIYISDFPVEAFVRAEPLLRQRAVAVLDGKPPVVRVIALNEKARRVGVEAGMTKLQAAVFAAPAAKSPAVLRPRSSEQENSAHSALLDVAHAFTPCVEDTAADTLLLDLTGLKRLYGAYMKMARELASRVSAVGLEANIALAANPDAALHAARGFSGVTVIPPGEEAQRLSVLPLPVLLEAVFELSLDKHSAAAREREKLRAQMLDTLDRWGVRDFRALAVLPEHALASRLGEVGTRLQCLARGAGMRTLVLCEPQSSFEEAMELESPVKTLEPLSFILNRLLEQLCARLEVRALAAQALHLRLQLERRVADQETTTVQELAGSSYSVRRSVFERTLQLPVAMRDVKVFLKLLQLELGAHPLGAPVTRVWITAEPALPRSAQHGLFQPASPEAEKLEITLARISGVVGERRSGIAQILDTHRPDNFGMKRFAATPKEFKPAKCPTMTDINGQTLLALRIFRPAWQLRVQLSEERPVHLSTVSPSRDRAELRGRVLWSAGPWCSSGDWWTENAGGKSLVKDQVNPWDREEWDVALANGNGTGVALYRIYRDLASGHWFADASYD
jgi:protein ImuB